MAEQCAAWWELREVMSEVALGTEIWGLEGSNLNDPANHYYVGFKRILCTYLIFTINFYLMYALFYMLNVVLQVRLAVNVNR